ncbi:SDR family NAD(P)-dependent oxidoreductase [Nocardioides sp. TF02-7]|uniref:SDR family NAD(P)-dependent oxidoreductase n=1 Tax=Nocardioides sp. TF02-7 TaxID=2917724 RepID=UPI001F055F7A|nr:SDR family NAD(P)-dependent oxidoreductase [Nocardioides sp. TF02-7]UMG91457.1 SDR family NAD(P)-dependent oxidoreductase [Nocardioides sp. TF02-7]
MDSNGLALVTGASSGIGRSLARQLVGHGYDVVIAAEDAELHEAAAELRRTGREVVPVQVDLTSPDGVRELWHAVLDRQRPLAAAVLNAGVGVGGPLAGTPLERNLEIVDLNVRSTVHLAKLAVDHMLAHEGGRILVTSSIAAVVPGPFQAAYAASKAFVHSFAEGIRHELKGTGVTVTSLMPGPTDTEFFERADMLDTPIGRGPKDDPEDVARDGFEAMMTGKPHVRAGSLRNKVIAEVGTHLPDRIGSRVMAVQTKPRS